MGDAIQQQLDRLMSLFLDEQAANRAHREEMQSRLDALSMGGSGQVESHVPPPHRHQRQSSGSSGSGLVPRYAKLDFPTFSGSKDPLGWLHRCEHFFPHQQTLEGNKVGLAAYHLDGNAQQWFIQFTEDYPEHTWEEFKSQCNLRFGPPIRSNKLGELAKLQQLGTISDYQTQFETLVSRAGTLTKLQRVQLYISGLKEEIAVKVELHHPQDLVTAMSISRLYEKRCLEASSIPTATVSTLLNTLGRLVKRLTHEEMTDRRRRGLCFNCDQPYIRGHQCAKLFWLELHDTDPLDGEPPTLSGT